MRQESLRREIIDLADIEDRPFTEKRSDHELVAFFNMVTQRLFTRAVSDTLLATPERDKVLADINSFLGRINDYASVTIGSLLAGKPCDFANVSDQIAIEYTPAVQVNQLSENTPVFVENIRCPGFVTVDPEGNRGVTLMIGNKKDNYSFLSPPYFFTLPRVQGDVSLIVSPKNFSLELLQKQFSPDEVSA
jgi:hypothetical protein